MELNSTSISNNHHYITYIYVYAWKYGIKIYDRNIINITMLHRYIHLHVFIYLHLIQSAIPEKWSYFFRNVITRCSHITQLYNLNVRNRVITVIHLLSLLLGRSLEIVFFNVILQREQLRASRFHYLLG